MIEPPGQLFRRRILEIDDGVLVAIEHGFIKQVARTMQQTGVTDISIRVDSFIVETRKGCRRSNAVEAVAVIKHAKFHKKKKPVILAIAE